MATSKVPMPSHTQSHTLNTNTAVPVPARGFRPTISFKMSSSEVAALKEQGNELYLQKRYAEAVRIYTWSWILPTMSSTATGARLASARKATLPPLLPPSATPSNASSSSLSGPRVSSAWERRGRSWGSFQRYGLTYASLWCDVVDLHGILSIHCALYYHQELMTTSTAHFLTGFGCV